MNCEGCEYYDKEGGVCAAFECNGIDCPELPCERYWIFTFGAGQQNAGKYVKIRGTHNQARKIMFENTVRTGDFNTPKGDGRKWKRTRTDSGLWKLSWR